MRSIATFILLLFCCSAFAQHATDTIRLFFDLNIRTLSKASEHKIDSLIYNDVILPKDNVLIVGYADFLGSEKYNQGLSEARANNVKDYLVKFGINADSVKLCIGKGKIERQGLTDPSGYPADRKVDIVLKRKANNKEKPAKIPKNVRHDQNTTMPVELKNIDKLKPGQAFVLHNIYFPPSSHDISMSLQTLQQLYQILVDYPRLKIQIEGHVCCISGYPDAYDFETQDNKLSVNRARAIYDYLIRKGISASRLKYIGYGKQRPVVAVEQTEEDAERNRRVEIRILEK